MRQYFLISWTVFAALMASHSGWHFATYATVYTYANGDTVRVVDSTMMDSMGMRGWHDHLVQYPISVNDSDDAHVVYLTDSEVIK